MSASEDASGHASQATFPTVTAQRLGRAGLDRSRLRPFPAYLHARPVSAPYLRCAIRRVASVPLVTLRAVALVSVGQEDEKRDTGSQAGESTALHGEAEVRHRTTPCNTAQYVAACGAAEIGIAMRHIRCHAICCGNAVRYSTTRLQRNVPRRNALRCNCIALRCSCRVVPRSEVLRDALRGATR